MLRSPPTLPEDVVLTVDYSVRGAMHTVYGLLGVDRPIPPVCHALSDPKVAFRVLEPAFTGVCAD